MLSEAKKDNLFVIANALGLGFSRLHSRAVFAIRARSQLRPGYHREHKSFRRAHRYRDLRWSAPYLRAASAEHAPLLVLGRGAMRPVACGEQAIRRSSNSDPQRFRAQFPLLPFSRRAPWHYSPAQIISN